MKSRDEVEGGAQEIPSTFCGAATGPVGLTRSAIDFGGGNEVVQELQSFFGQINQDRPNPGDVSAGLVEAGGEAEF